MFGQHQLLCGDGCHHIKKKIVYNIYIVFSRVYSTYTYIASSAEIGLHDFF